jgi:hypothetical protein
MLSDIDRWKERQEDQTRRRMLFQGMAGVILSLAHVPQPRIGLFRFRDDGTVILTNRPLLCSVAILSTSITSTATYEEGTCLAVCLCARCQCGGR